MNREKVIEILEFYRDAEKTVKLNNRVIKNLEDQYYSSVGSPRLDGMPRAQGGGASAVENIAINIPASVRKTIQVMERENERLGKARVEIMRELNGLTFAQKTIVYDFYIQGYQWERVSAQINYSVRQCKNIRTRALDKLARRFTANKVISRYHFPAK